MSQRFFGRVGMVAGRDIIINGRRVGGGGFAGVTGSGRVVSEEREARPIRHVVLDAPVRLTFHPFHTPIVRVAGDDNILELITTTIQGDALYIGCTGSFIASNEISVGIAMPQPLESLRLDGSGDAELNDLRSHLLRITVNGSGTVVASGSVAQLEASLHGSGDVKARKLVAESATLSLHGSGDIRAHVTGSVIARLHGSGDIRIDGNPSRRDVQCHGSGDIEFED
jgi:hypothetical protein